MLREVPSYLETKVKNSLLQDFSPSYLRASYKIGFATILGGLVSLSVCGQFGVGFTDFSMSMTHHAHQNMDPLFCATLCGALFSVFPILILKICLTNFIEFKSLIKQRKMVFLVWYILFGAGLAYLGTQTYQLTFFISWWLGAWVSTLLGSYAFNSLQEKFQSLTGNTFIPILRHKQ